MIYIDIAFIAGLLIIYILGWINAVQMLSNDEDTSAFSRMAIIIGCAFWPVAVAIAVFRIVVYAVVGSSNQKGEKKS